MKKLNSVKYIVWGRIDSYSLIPTMLLPKHISRPLLYTMEVGKINLNFVVPSIASILHKELADYENR